MIPVRWEVGRRESRIRRVDSAVMMGEFGVEAVPCEEFSVAVGLGNNTTITLLEAVILGDSLDKVESFLSAGAET